MSTSVVVISLLTLGLYAYVFRLAWPGPAQSISEPEDINKNKRIITYDGEKITAKESEDREDRYLRRGEIWCFRLNRRWVIDANVGGNIARFINHSCKPNCYSNVINGRIWIVAGKAVKPSEELTYNYHTDGDKEIQCRCCPGCKNWL
mgnify:CR=1 FL=1